MARVWIEDRAKHKSYKDGVAKAKETSRKAPDRWRVRWYEPDSAKKSKSFAKKAQAEDYAADTERKLADGTYRDPTAGKTPLRDIAENWWKNHTVRKQSTKRNYRQLLD